MKTFKIFGTAVLALSLSSCAIIRPGEVGVKQSFGKLS